MFYDPHHLRALCPVCTTPFKQSPVMSQGRPAGWRRVSDGLKGHVNRPVNHLVAMAPSGEVGPNAGYK